MVTKIHIIGENITGFESELDKLSKYLVSKATGEEVFTIVERPGVSSRLIAGMENSFIKLVVCGIGPSQFRGINYVDMSQPDQKKGAQQRGDSAPGRMETFSDAGELNKYLALKANRIFVVGRKPYLQRFEKFVSELNETLPPLSHKKLVCKELGG